MKPQTLTGGQAVVKALRAAGVDTIFGIPGTHILSIYDALLDEPGIRRILPRHEQGAGFMADGYARATGRPGVAIVTGGPGLSNASTAISEAYVDSSPVLVISSEVDSRYAGQERGNLHEMKDQAGFMRAITGWHVRATRVAEIPTLIYEAMRRFQTERPRPVHIEIPIDVLDASEEVTIPIPQEYSKPSGDVTAIAEAADLIRASQRPLIYAGGGVATSGAERELLQLAQLLDAPVLTSVMGKGAIPSDHPLALVGSRRFASPARSLIENSDLVLAIGTKLGAMATENWSLPLSRNLIHIDIDRTVIGQNYPTRLGIVGDAKLVLQQLIAALADDPGQRPSRADQVAEVVRRHLAQGWINTPQQMRLLTDLRQALDRDAIVAWDMTLLGYASTTYFHVYQTRTYLYPWTSGTLGFGLPAAIGAKVGQPERQVVAICGDGGFLFTGEELVAAVQHSIPVVVVVLNDHCYSAVKNLQHRRYPGRYVDVELSPVDYVKLAEAYGARGMRVEPEGLKGALAEALHASGPVLIEVPVQFERPW